MAKQHFYSCVPAKMSLFNRMDGYDTFAHSDGLTDEQIAGLSIVYDNKPTKEDTELMWDGKLPPVYAQFVGADGVLVQSCISFIKSDYTGERSSYMVHSLLLDGNEKSEHLHSLDTACINKDVFKHDISDFDLTSSDSSPDTHYPEISVPVKPAISTEGIAKDYDTGMLKRLIYTLVGVSCGKIKSLYLSLPSAISDFSENCLDFINGLLQIFPYHIREMLSFVTYIGDFTKFTQFKIKCIPENAPAIPTSKGISIRMGIKDFSGVTDENVAVHAETVDFFYSLLSNADMRSEFCDFCDYAVKSATELARPSFKNLSDLIFLFKYLSGYFDESDVLPDDDKVYDFITVYDKNRIALKQEYKDRAVEFLHRYPQTHTAIPKNVFTKISNIYSSESIPFKKTVMSVSLDLIHTDLMREKLFLFIKANYEGESSETKKLIMQNLCSVYYGGFLQEALYEFFSEHFKGEPQSVQDLILEKLMLTIRTPKVQKSVLQFVDEYYESFTDAQKQKVYDTFYEMLPMSDNLSRGLSNVIDGHIDEGRKAKVSASF